MPRYVLTGAPGTGKAVILRALERAGRCRPRRPRSWTA
jgi:predicted ATPase